MIHTSDRAAALQLLDRLLHVQRYVDQFGSGTLRRGICYLVRFHTIPAHQRWVARLLLNHLFRTWPGYFGDITYPVAGEAEYASDCRPTWDPATAAGKRRRELLTFCIETLQASLAETPTYHGAAQPSGFVTD